MSNDRTLSNIKKALTVLNYTKENSEYNLEYYAPGYHSIRLGNYYFRGRRECRERLLSTGINFSNKVVFDIGCNTGGMIHELADEVSTGIGIDYDAKCINAANLIKQVNDASNIFFYVFDLENEDLNLIKNFILTDRIDICLLLSVCRWIKNWEEVIRFTTKISNMLIFESNGAQWQQTEQVNFLKKTYKAVRLVNLVSDDDMLRTNRKLYICNN